MRSSFIYSFCARIFFFISNPVKKITTPQGPYHAETVLIVERRVKTCKSLQSVRWICEVWWNGAQALEHLHKQIPKKDWRISADRSRGVVLVRLTYCEEWRLVRIGWLNSASPMTFCISSWFLSHDKCRRSVAVASQTNSLPQRHSAQGVEFNETL